MRLILAGLALLCFASAAKARDYTIGDMLALEGYGKASISPDGRIAIVERLGRYDRAARFSYGFVTRRMTSRVMMLDLRRHRPLVPAFDQEEGAGYWTGTFSPSGAKLTVFRMRDDRLTVGILDVANRTVRWLPGAPDLPVATPSPLWLDNNRIAYARFASDRLPLIMEFGGIVQRTMPARWEAAARGGEAADLASTTFTGTVARERRDLVIADATTGGERVLAAGEIFDLQLSPDRGEVALLELGDGVSPDPGTSVTETYVGRRMRLRLIKVDDGSAVTPCPHCDVARGSIRFSERSEVAFIARRDGQAWATARSVVFSNGTLKLQSPEAVRPAQLEWVGDHLLARSSDSVWGTVGFGTSPDRLLGRYAFLGSAQGSLWLSDQQGAWRVDSHLKPAKVAPAGFASADIDFEDSSSVGSNRLRRPELPVLRYDEASADRVVFGFEERRSSSIQLPAGAKVLAASGVVGVVLSFATDGRGVGYLYLNSVGSPPALVDTISAHLADVDLLNAIPIQRKIVNQSAIDWLILPKGNGPFPLVVFPYQGTVYGSKLPLFARPGWFGPAFKAQLLTSKGYAVLFPSIPAGPAGHPQDTLGGDLDAAVDAAITTGLVDSGRMAVFGQSYGGVNALTIAARSNRYRAVISVSGMNDLAAVYGSVPPAQRVSFAGGPPLDLLNWFENGQSRMGAPPWIEPERYRQASSLFQADRMTVPILLVAADLDYAPIEQAEHLFVGLARLGRDATLLRVYGESHLFQSPGNIRLEYDTVLKFLKEKMPEEHVPPPGLQPQ